MKYDNKSLYKYIGKNVKKLRLYRGITPKELARKINVVDGTIRNIESGKSVSLPLLILISTALEVPIDSFLYDYTYHNTNNSVDSGTIEIFCEVYKSCPEHDRKLLMELLIAYLESSKKLHLKNNENNESNSE